MSDDLCWSVGADKRVQETTQKIESQLFTTIRGELRSYKHTSIMNIVSSALCYISPSVLTTCLNFNSFELIVSSLKKMFAKYYNLKFLLNIA